MICPSLFTSKYICDYEEGIGITRRKNNMKLSPVFFELYAIYDAYIFIISLFIREICNKEYNKHTYVFLSTHKEEVNVYCLNSKKYS